ncbi:hypothetical protein D3C84_416990 [compost metagenome]
MLAVQAAVLAAAVRLYCNSPKIAHSHRLTEFVTVARRRCDLALCGPLAALTHDLSGMMHGSPELSELRCLLLRRSLRISRKIHRPAVIQVCRYRGRRHASGVHPQALVLAHLARRKNLHFGVEEVAADGPKEPRHHFSCLKIRKFVIGTYSFASRGHRKEQPLMCRAIQNPLTKLQVLLEQRQTRVPPYVVEGCFPARPELHSRQLFRDWRLLNFERVCISKLVKLGRSSACDHHEKIRIGFRGKTRHLKPVPVALIFVGRIQVRLCGY